MDSTANFMKMLDQFSSEIDKSDLWHRRERQHIEALDWKTYRERVFTATDRVRFSLSHSWEPLMAETHLKYLRSCKISDVPLHDQAAARDWFYKYMGIGVEYTTRQFREALNAEAKLLTEWLSARRHVRKAEEYNWYVGSLSREHGGVDKYLYFRPDERNPYRYSVDDQVRWVTFGGFSPDVSPIEKYAVLREVNQGGGRFFWVPFDFHPDEKPEFNRVNLEYLGVKSVRLWNAQRELIGVMEY